MPFLTPTLIGPGLAEYRALPLQERIRRQAVDWAERGLGAPTAGPLFYLVKILLWAVLGLWIAVASSGLGSMWDHRSWWAEPIIYEKVLLWAMLWEALSLGAASGPATFHFIPPVTGVLHWLRPGTVRRPPWGGRLPLTGGDRRTIVDVLLYVAVLAALAYGLAIPGRPSAELAAALPAADGGLLPAHALALPLLPLVLLGLRDQVPFLATRAEQYAPALVFGVVLSPVDFMIAVKCLIAVVWIGAAVSKLGPHFTNVIGPMMSNSPFMPFPAVNRRFYRDVPSDLRPSRLSTFVGHVLGTAVELLAPLVLLLSTAPAWTAVAAVLIFGMHVVITSTLPLAVPLEWNIHFLFLIPFLFFGFPAWAGFGLHDLSSAPVAVFVAVALLTLPVVGNIRPDLVSFLPSMRQYAGNWAATMWAFRPGALERFYAAFPAATGNQEALLERLYGRDASVKLLEKAIAFRALHSQGRGLLSLLVRELGDEIEGYTLREGENICAWALGWNFGDGHFHGVPFMHTVQDRMGFAPGDVVAVFAESQPIHRRTQRYAVVDLAAGVIEEGTWNVADAVAAQPWLPGGPIPVRPDARYRGRRSALGADLPAVRGPAARPAAGRRPDPATR